MPLHPGPTPNNSHLPQWKQKADLFVRHILTDFRSETDFCDATTQTNNCEHFFEELERWITELQEDSNVISKFQLMQIGMKICALGSWFSAKNGKKVQGTKHFVG